MLFSGFWAWDFFIIVNIALTSHQLVSIDSSYCIFCYVGMLAFYLSAQILVAEVVVPHQVHSSITLSKIIPVWNSIHNKQ